MRLALTILFFIALTTPVLAEEIDDRWVYYGDSYELEDAIVSIGDAGTPEKLVLAVEGRSFILDIDGECRDNDDRQEQYCIADNAYEPRDEDHIHYEAGDELFGYRVITNSLVPQLEVERTVSPSSFSYQEPSTVTLTIENTGERAIEDLVYRDEELEGIDLDPIEGSVRSGVFTYERSTLGAGQDVTIQYRLTPVQYVTTTMRPNLTYEYDNKKLTTDVSTLTVSIPSPIEVERTFKDDASPGEEVVYELTIENTADDTMTLTVDVTKADGMTIDSRGDFLYDGDDLTQDVEVAAGESETLTFTTSADLIAEHNFQIELEGTVGDESITRFYQELLTTSITTPEARIQPSSTPLIAGREATIRFYLESPDDEIRNVDLEASGLVNESLSASSIRAGEERLLAETTLIPREGTHTIALEGSYETVTGERLTITREDEYEVLSSDERFTIEHETNEDSFAPGERVRVSVNVENNGEPIFAEIEEDVPFETSGTTRADVTLARDESRQLYIYEFTIPQGYDDPGVSVTTTITTEDETYERTIEIPVSNEEPQEDDDETPEPEEDLDGEDEEEPGIITRIWDWLKGFFS